MPRFFLLVVLLCFLTSCSQSAAESLPTPLLPTKISSVSTLPASAPETPTRPTASGTSLPENDWRTYQSPGFPIALDYPENWSADEDSTGIHFTSPQGVKIDLRMVDLGSTTPEDYLNEQTIPNTRCSSGANKHGIVVRTCFDTLAGSYSADFVIEATQGEPQLFTLVMRAKGEAEVFKAMAASVRPIL